MNAISKVCVWIFSLSIPLTCALAADTPTSGTLPSGETAAEFLIRQVGGGYAELTTDTQKKKPLQLLMEELVLADGRKDAKGKWIDDIPDTKPSPLPDIAPQLTTMTLYYDREAVNAHWDAFLKRHYLTANFIKDNVGRPSMRRLPGNNFDIWAKIWRWNGMVEVGYKTREAYLKDMGRALLYVDFLYSRGDDEAKTNAFKLLDLQLMNISHDKFRDETLATYVCKEMVWPMLDPEHQRYSHWSLNCVRGIHYRSKDAFLRVEKWAVNHAPDEGGQKMNFLLRRSNQYATLGDYTGAMFCTLAANPIQKYNIQTIQCLKVFLQNQHGTEKGQAYYKRFLECVASETQDADIKKEVNHFKNAGEKKDKAPHAASSPPSTALKEKRK